MSLGIIFQVILINAKECGSFIMLVRHAQFLTTPSHCFPSTILNPVSSGRSSATLPLSQQLLLPNKNV